MTIKFNEEAKLVFINKEANQVIHDLEVPEGWQVRVDNSPGIKIDGVNIKNDYGWGIYFRWSDGATLQNAIIENSPRIGIYLEWSDDITVRDCDIKNAGHKVNLRQMLPPLAPLIKKITGKEVNYISAPPWWRREGIAVDAVTNCNIHDNHITNCAMGITVYSNCGERGRKPSRPATGNKIFGNTITTADVGIWLASRQYYDLIGWGCTREGKKLKFAWQLPGQPYSHLRKMYPPYFNFFGLYHEDWTWGNEQSHNKFYNCKYSVVDNQIDWSVEENLDEQL